MSARIRGQETTVRVLVDGQEQAGSFFKIKDFTVTPRADLMENDYLGELESDLDFQHHGFDFSFSVDMQDASTIDFLSNIVSREQFAIAHPNITMSVIYAFRDGTDPRIETYYGVFLKMNDTSFSGRKEYVSVSFEGKCKRRLVSSL